MKKQILKRAFLDTLPVMTGYLFLGFGFGILMYQSGYGILWSTAMSALIYAGSMQYVAVGLLTSGAGLITAALTTLLVNARHLFYGVTMIEPYRDTGKTKSYLIFSLTDETFSLVSSGSFSDKNERCFYFIFVSLLDHIYWVAGTALGGLAGSVLSVNLEGIEFVLTALFVTVFVEQWLSTKNHLPAICGVVVTALSLLIFGKDIFLIPSMLIITASLTMMSKVKKKSSPIHECKNVKNENAENKCAHLDDIGENALACSYKNNNSGARFEKSCNECPCPDESIGKEGEE